MAGDAAKLPLGPLLRDRELVDPSREMFDLHGKLVDPGRELLDLRRELVDPGCECDELIGKLPDDRRQLEQLLRNASGGAVRPAIRGARRGA
ncbi:MAG TPA: hypothetical protein VFC93_01560 [Chloroflexota bacterium]|nr:hypothetical protein [Chloroflexota bacterium]